MKRALFFAVSFGALAGARVASAEPSGGPGDSVDVPVLPADEKVPAPAPIVEAPTVPRPEPAYRVAEEDAGERPEAPPRYDLVRVNVGPRIGYVGTRGFDTFAKNDVLAQLSIDATYPVLSRGKLVLGAGLGYDVGGRSDSLRGLDASLQAHRFYVPIEARYAVFPGLVPFVKVSPGAALAAASIADGTSTKDLSATGWAFALDASVGASILLGPRKRLDRRLARFWLTPEIGYAATTAAKLSVATGRDDKDVLGSDERTNLRSLALSGLFWRATVGVTF